MKRYSEPQNHQVKLFLKFGKSDLEKVKRKCERVHMSMTQLAKVLLIETDIELKLT